MSMKPTGSTDPAVIALIRDLRKKSNSEDAPLWKAISKQLQKPSRNRGTVNLSKISRYTEKGDLVAVPGKVLSSGDLKHEVTIAALSFSEYAREKIEKANGKAVTFYQLMDQFPKGTDVKIMK